jgi:hypothetical protein
MDDDAGRAAHEDRAEVARALHDLAVRWEHESHPEHEYALRLAAAELRETCARLGLDLSDAR